MPSDAEQIAEKVALKLEPRFLGIEFRLQATQDAVGAAGAQAEVHDKILFRESNGHGGIVHLTKDNTKRLDSIWRLMWMLVVIGAGIFVHTFWGMLAREAVRNGGGE